MGVRGLGVKGARGAWGGVWEGVWSWWGSPCMTEQDEVVLTGRCSRSGGQDLEVPVHERRGEQKGPTARAQPPGLGGGCWCHHGAMRTS